MKNPGGNCQCGCGRRTDPSPASRRGYKKGEPLRFIKGHSSRKGGPDFEITDGGCWLWLKYTDQNGYGKTWDGAKVVHAHRAYYERYVGFIPQGMELHHLCEVPSCVNPAHLLLCTRRAHMRLDGRKAFGRHPIKEIA